MGTCVRRFGWLVVVALLLFGALGVASPAPVAAANFTVNSCLDSGGGTLRQALSSAAGASGDDTIQFTVDCTGANTITVSTSLVVDSNVTISANAHTVTLTGGSIAQVFRIVTGVTATIDGVSIINTTVAGDVTIVSGAAITAQNSSTLYLNNVTLSGNAANNGGAIFTNGVLAITNSTINGNTAGSGGAIFTGGGNTSEPNLLVVVNSTITGNIADAPEGDCTDDLCGELNIDNPFEGLFNPENPYGPTRQSPGAPTGLGGGIYFTNGTRAAFINTTISGNSAGVGGAIYNVGINGSSILLTNTIVAGDTATTSDPEIYGQAGSLGHNLFGTFCTTATLPCTTVNGTLATGDIVNANPGLSALASNGGPTQTLALQFTSPALNAGDNTVCAKPLPPPIDPTSSAQLLATNNGAGNVDQRGTTRPQGTQCDIGAFELRTPNLTINDLSLNEGNTGTTTFQFTVSLSAPADVDGVTFDIATAAGTATTTDNDYTAQTLTGQTIASGASTYTFNVAVTGDLSPETNETFFVNATNAAGAIITDGQGQGTIQNDDVAPNLTINDVSLNEGNAGTTTFTFTVSLSSPAPPGGVTFDIATADDTATAPSDYTTKSLTAQTIPALSSTYTFDVLVNGDTTFEPNETFFVNVTNVTGAVVTDSQGQGTIQNDDTPAAPSAPDLQAASDTGTSNSDDTTKLTSLTFDIAGVTAGATVDLFRVGGATAVATGTAAGTTITLTDSGPVTQGPHTYTAKQTVSGTPSLTSAGLIVTVDTAAPTVTINQAAVGQADPTSASPINFTATFNEPVSGFTGSNVTLSGTAGATTANVTEIAPMDGTHYTVAVSGMTISGTVIAAIQVNAVTDIAGNGNAASSSTDNTVTYQRLPTHFSVSASGTATAGSAFNFTVTALDANNATVTEYTGTVQFTSTDLQVSAGSGLPGSYQFTGTGGDNGVHTFSATLKTAGGQTITATDGGITGTSNTITVGAGLATNITADPATTPQSAQVNTAFTVPLAAIVKDAFGNPVSGVSVMFVAPGSGASGTFAGGVTTATTNASGVATAPIFTANATAGSYNVTANRTGTSFATPATFALMNTAGAPGTITAVTGDGQSASINTAFATNLQAKVTDASNNPLSGVTVTFTAPTSGASGTFTGTGTNTATATTNASGIATAPVFTANAIAGSYTVAASALGVSAPATFSLSNTTGTPTSIVAVAGSGQTALGNTAFTTNLQAKVTDAGSNPLGGVSVTFTAPASGASGTFACPSGGCPAGTTVAPSGKSATALTNASGIATAPPFTANTTAGTYNVTANLTSGPLATPASFALTNSHGTVTQITLSGISGGTPVKVGQSIQLTATATYTDGTTQDVTAQVTWTSSNTNIATVGTHTGLATFLAPGQVTITATFVTTSGTAGTQATVTGSIQVTVNPGTAVGVAPVPAPAGRPGSAGTGTTPSGSPAPAPAPRTGP